MAKSKGTKAQSALNKIDLDLGYPTGRGGKKKTTKKQPPAHGRTAGFIGKIFGKKKKKKVPKKKAGPSQSQIRLQTEEAMGMYRNKKQADQKKKLKKK